MCVCMCVCLERRMCTECVCVCMCVCVCVCVCVCCVFVGCFVCGLVFCGVALLKAPLNLSACSQWRNLPQTHPRSGQAEKMPSKMLAPLNYRKRYHFLSHPIPSLPPTPSPVPPHAHTHTHTHTHTQRT